MEMDILDTYDIPWKGLPNGRHVFRFAIDDRFFGEAAESDIRGGALQADVTMDKSAAMLLLEVTIKGEVTVPCDRCLGDLRLPVNYDGVLTVRFSDLADDYDGETLWLNPAAETVPLTQYIYESIVLSLPYRKVHGTDAAGEPLCDGDMLARFRIVTPEEFDAMNGEARTLSSTEEGGKLQQLRKEMENEEKKR